MEIIFIEKQTFDELVVRRSLSEKKVIGLCSQTKDAGLKKWMDNQEAVSYTHLDVYKRQCTYCTFPSSSSTQRSLEKRKVSKVRPSFFTSDLWYGSPHAEYGFVSSRIGQRNL